MTSVNEIYLELKKRYKGSTRIFLLINLTIFIVSAVIIVLNVFAIRKNPADQPFIKWLFVAVTILTAVSGFIGSLISLYVFRKRNKSILEKTDKIEFERKQHKEKAGDYALTTNRDAMLINKVTKIIND